MTLLLAVSVTPLGCMSGAWEKALETDTPQAYHRFIRANPDSERVADAQERIEFHKVKRRPSLRRYEEFRSTYPNSRLLDNLRPLIEGQAFDAARASGSSAAYGKFAEEFPGGPYASRAEGNALYLDADGFAGKPDDLRSFAAEHPDSDFAAEAMRSVKSLETRRGTGFRRVGLVIDILPGTPEARRLIEAFTERAKEDYQHSGVQLLAIPEIAPPDAPRVRLTIKHGEGLKAPNVSEAGTVSRAGVLAQTVVTLRDGSEGPPIFERRFALRIDAQDHIGRASMLFASKRAKRYWDQFFVPVASWRSTAAVSPVLELQKKATAVDAVLARAVVLFSDGDFQLMGLSDPHKPVVLARYDRKSKLEKFGGVKIIGNNVMLYGQDGLEIVSFTSQGPTAIATHSRGEVGQVSAIIPAEEGLLLASSMGLLLADADGSNPERLMRRIVRGLDAMGDTIVFVDGDSVFASTVPMLRENRVIAQLPLGQTFKPERVRVEGRNAVVMGEGGVVIIDLSKPSKPRLISKLVRRNTGRVHDVTRIGEKVVLLGVRGAQILDPSGTRIVEVIDVKPHARVARTGRHLVMVGEKQLQVVDGLPFAATGARPAAAP